MKNLKISFPVSRRLQNNILFNPDQKEVFIRDQSLDRYYLLHEMLSAEGHEIATDDLIAVKDADMVIYNDKTDKIKRAHPNQILYLVLLEPPVILPKNYAIERHAKFDKIFTWHDDLVDDKKYFKLNFAQKFPAPIPNEPRTRFCTTIAGNKTSSLPNELYSRRVEFIRWFEANHPDRFDLYGVGWNEYFFEGPKIVRAFNRVPMARSTMFRFFGDTYPSYRGKVENKFQTLKNYNFTICYENNEKIPGYITEKILDAFFAGSIPIYLGADNVSEYIPKNCFIDQRDFKTFEETYSYMAGLDENSLRDYRDNIATYLNSKAAIPFRSEHFAKTIVNHILMDASK